MDMAKLLSGIGMDYYHESMGYNTPSNAEILVDLANIQILTNKIKIYHNPYTNNGGISAATSLAACQNITSLAKGLGMTVVWTVNVDNAGGYLTDANWADYTSKVQADADVAQIAGADEFLLGNEIGLHNNGDAGFSPLPARIKTLYAATTSHFSNPISYEGYLGEISAWVSAGLGSLPKIYFNVYSPESTFQSSCQTIFDAFGNNGIIGEFSTNSGLETIAKGDQDLFASMIRRRIDIMNNIGLLNAYYFEWRGSSTTLYSFGLLRKNDTSNNMSLAWNSFFQGRRFITT